MEKRRGCRLQGICRGDWQVDFRADFRSIQEALVEAAMGHQSFLGEVVLFVERAALDACSLEGLGIALRLGIEELLVRCVVEGADVVVSDGGNAAG